MGSNYPKAIEYLRVIGNSDAHEMEKVLYEIAKHNPSVIVNTYERLYPVAVNVEVVVTGANELPMKIGAIKAIREHLKLGLKESKDLIELPMPIHIDTGEPLKARSLAAALNACGYKAEIRNKEAK